MDDDQLLRQFVQDRSQEAFGKLVEKHLGMVFSTAQRIVRDAHLAEEVTQGVFATLAQKGAGLRAPTVIGGWLYNTTRHLAMHTVRAEQRRRQREDSAAAMQPLSTEPETAQILEELEPAMAELEENDRGALVLRYLEGRNLRDVGAGLGITEDAARMRVNRALERLREIFARRGVTITSVTLAAVLTTATVNTIPTGLAAAILAGAGAATLTQTAITTMSWINAKSAAAMAAAALLAGTGSYWLQHREAERLKADTAVIQAQLDKMKADVQTAQDALAAKDAELARMQKNSEDLAKARNEVAALRQRQATSASNAAPTNSASAAKSSRNAFPKGTYITRDQISFAGYESPEATVQSLAWAAIKGEKGTVEHVLTQVALAQDPNIAEELSGAMQMAGPVLKGMVVVAEKVLADNRVELMVKIDVDSTPETQANLPPPYNIMPMLRIDNEWKLGGPPQDYKESWLKEGDVKTFTQ